MATASAGRATRVRRRLPRIPRALAAPPSRGLRAGQGEIFIVSHAGHGASGIQRATIRVTFFASRKGSS
jgi:hypothetical protein